MVAAVADASSHVQPTQDLKHMNRSVVGQKLGLQSPSKKLHIWQEVRLAIMKVSGLFGHGLQEAKSQAFHESESSITWDDSLDIKNLLIACEYMS
jgi:hypothetical protein